MNDPEFTKLRQLLTLKKHEKPPPGFFENFPGRVISRIELQDQAPAQSWLVRYFHGWRRPAVSWSLAAAACLAIFFSVIAFMREGPQDSRPVTARWEPAGQEVLMATNETKPPSLFRELELNTVPARARGTNQ